MCARARKKTSEDPSLQTTKHLTKGEGGEGGCSNKKEKYYKKGATGGDYLEGKNSVKRQEGQGQLGGDSYREVPLVGGPAIKKFFLNREGGGFFQ